MPHKKISALLILFILMSACGTLSREPTPAQLTGIFDGKINIGGRSLSLICGGEGVPTVIFEGDQGENRNAWGAVILPTVAFAHACSYTRANLTGSDPAPRPRRPRRLIQRLSARSAIARRIRTGRRSHRSRNHGTAKRNGRQRPSKTFM